MTLQGTRRLLSYKIKCVCDQGTSSPLGSEPGGGVGLGMEGVGSLWWRRGGGGSKLSRRAVSSMQMVFKSDALGDDWPRRSVDLPLIGAAREE
ncbi:hypothetical protein ILYODFUR_006379 [Ilyodon furcidens]|uniref:Uncharacterized protein n=1 Tax=Ilyodon furcidens TaxID=33524 RepID=A0ABV0TKF2_9TELE